MKTKDYSEIKIAVVCREINPSDGSIHVYLCELTTLEKIMIISLAWRQRYNHYLQYFIITEENYNNESTREYLFELIKNNKKSSMIIDLEQYL